MQLLKWAAEAICTDYKVQLYNRKKTKKTDNLV